MRLFGHRTDSGQTDKATDTGRTDRRTQASDTVVSGVRIGAGVLWLASAVWTTVSVHHVIGEWSTSGVVTAIIESAYALATVWFHSSRSRLSALALVAALVPVVAALAYADVDMFGPVGWAFAFGPVIAEGGFLLAAHLGMDPAALTAEQQRELAELRRSTRHADAQREAKLAAELADIKADAVRQMALDLAAAETQLQRNDLDRKLRMSGPSVPVVRPDTTGPAQPVVSGPAQPVVSADVRSDKPLYVDMETGVASDQPRPAAGQTLSGQVSEVVRQHQADKATDNEEPVRPSAPARLSAVRPGGLSGAVRSVLSEQPDITNAALTVRVSEILGAPQKPDSVAKTRNRQQRPAA